MLAWCAVVAAVGVPLFASGMLSPTDATIRNPLVQNLVALSVVAPIVVVAAWLESSRGATIGKRLLKLSVTHRAGPPGFGRALLRNSLKLGLPWMIGHAAVFALWDSSESGASSGWAIWLLGAAYVLPLLWVASLLAPGRRTVYDRISATTVRCAVDRSHSER